MTEVVLDGEEQALRALGRNASRIRVAIGSVATALGVAIGIPAYWVVRAVMFEVLGTNIFAVTVVIAYGIPCVTAILLARGLSRALIRSRQEAWITELAQQHGVPADRLRESTVIL